LGDNGCESEIKAFSKENISLIRALKWKYGEDQMKVAHSSLRSMIASKGRTLSKEFLQSSCKIVSNFDHFYQYFVNFLNEVEQGIVSKRLKKSNKLKMTQEDRFVQVE
jgi:hypothetical protein